MAYRCTGLAVGLSLLFSAPASAQFYWKPADISGAPVTGAEADIVGALPGATPAEQSAALLWNLRSALNVAALQCQFAPTLLTLNQYNHLIDHHGAELAAAFGTLTNYFKRTVPGARAAQGALDQYGTRTYSGYSMVQAQLSFCLAASDIGEAALSQPKGQLVQVARNRMRELRNSLKWRGDDQFRHYIVPYYYVATLPNLADECWTDEDEYRDSCRV